jgi:hypothetical protein
MAIKPTKAPTAKTTTTLAKLRRLYGHQYIQYDVFGRRLALPSEVAAQVRKNKPAGGKS